MVEADFWASTQTLLDERALLSLTAQADGDEIVREIAESLQAYVGYRPSLISRPVKRRQRILEKARKIMDENPKFSPGQVVDQITDLAGARLLVVGVGDILLAENWMRQLLTGRASCRSVGDAKVHLERAKESGFRGLLQKLELTLTDGSTFPYEVQVMTHLEHSWAELQHIHYELIRAGASDAPSPEMRVALQNLSDKLFELDREIDVVRRRM